jgi:hypothetical protein
VADTFFISYGVRVWVKPCTLAATAPTSSAGMTELINLIDQPFELGSETKEIITQGSSQGFKKSIITSSEWMVPLEMNLDVTSAGYQILKYAGLNAAKSGVDNAVQFWMETPVTDGSGDTPESHAGVGQIADFKPEMKAGDVAIVKCKIQGFGDPVWTEQTGAGGGTGIATLTITSGGAGLTAATAVPLIGGSGYGATATVTVSGGVINGATIVSGGTNYVVGNQLTILSSSVVGAGDTLPTLVVATVG